MTKCYTFQDQCQGLVRVVVAAGDCSTKVLLGCTLGDEQQRQLALRIVTLLLVRNIHFA